jgi:hypothetical protein
MWQRYRRWAGDPSHLPLPLIPFPADLLIDKGTPFSSVDSLEADQ